MLLLTVTEKELPENVEVSENVELSETEPDPGIESENEFQPPIKRTAYGCHQQANFILKYEDKLQIDPNMSMREFGRDENISHSMLSRWLADKEDIQKKALEGCNSKNLSTFATWSFKVSTLKVFGPYFLNVKY